MEQHRSRRHRCRFWIPPSLLILAVLGSNGALGQSIVTQPPAVAFATAGQPTSLSISAEGSALTYQWRRFGAAIAGATAATLRLEYVAMTDAGFYDVVVTSGAARVTSNATRLEIRPAVLPGAVGPRTGFPAAIEGEKGAEARGIAMAGDGALVFGSYTTVNGLPYTGLVRLTTTGQVDTNFQPPVFSDDTLQALCAGRTARTRPCQVHSPEARAAAGSPSRAPAC